MKKFSKLKNGTFLIFTNNLGQLGQMKNFKIEESYFSDLYYHFGRVGRDEKILKIEESYFSDLHYHFGTVGTDEKLKKLKNRTFLIFTNVLGKFGQMKNFKIEESYFSHLH